jgi:hypothetical protein
MKDRLLKVALGIGMCTLIGWQIVETAGLVKGALDFFSVHEEDDEPELVTFVKVK